MKTFRHAFLSALLPLMLVACGQQGEAAPGAPAAAAQPAAPASGATDATAQPAFTPVAGTHYVEIEDPAPFQPLNGQIEVVEVFGYTCPACASFEPLVSAWKQRQPDDVRVSLVAAPFGGPWQPFAKAFYAAESMGLVDATHKPMFDAIHRERRFTGQPDTDSLAAFYASYGADPARFAQAMESFAVSGQMRRAIRFLDRTGVDATPTMVVNGKYRVLSNQPFEDVLRITDHLVELERAAGAGSDDAGAEAEADADADAAADANADAGSGPAGAEAAADAEGEVGAE